MNGANVGRWLRSLHVQLFLWAVMPVTFVLIAFSFTGVYAHQRTMRDFVVERDQALARMAAQIAEDSLAYGVVGGDGRDLARWMDLDSKEYPGTFMVVDRDGQVLAHSLSSQVGTNAANLPGSAEALTQRSGFVIVQDDSRSMLVAFAPVEGTEWTVIVREPVDDLIGPLLRFPSLIPIVAVGAGLLSLLILFFGWWTIVRPLLQLVRSAEQVSWAKYDSIAQPIQGVQEVRDLHRALAEMVDRIRGYEEGVRDYLGAITQGQEAERARLARELHDGPVQGLIALNQRAEMAQRQVLRDHKQDAQALLEQMRHTGQQMVLELHRMIGALRPIYLEDLGFFPSLEMLVRQAQERTDAQVRLEKRDTACQLGPEAELAAYRIAQEALNNALQHAHAQHITVGVRCDVHALILTVVDDGIGFVFPTKPDLLTSGGHFGLIGMRERATQVGGTLDVRAAPGQGTRVVVRFPARSPNSQIIDRGSNPAKWRSPDLPPGDTMGSDELEAHR